MYLVTKVEFMKMSTSQKKAQCVFRFIETKLDIQAQGNFSLIKTLDTFVPATRNLLDNLAGFGIRPFEWKNHKWNAKYCENVSRLCVFIPRTSARLVGMSLSRAVWVKLNRLRTVVGQFHSSMHKWGLAPSPNCECGASEQIADYVLIACSIHRAPHGARGLTVLDDETRCWFNNITASI